jgi:phage tail-like protein
MTRPGPARAAFTAPGALAGHLTAPARTSGVPVPEYGMTMWFRVTVGLTGGDLGLWSACGGLGVRFETQEVPVGGHYDRPTPLPLRLGYGEITLERAMTTTDSGKVQAWLRHVAANWVNDAEGGAPGAGGRRFHPGTTAHIALYHRIDEDPVAEWTLRDVVPVSWTAPKLATTGGTVAIETLVLAHGGFLDSDGHGTGKATVSGQGNLVLSGPGARPVTFQYNPDSVTADRMVSISDGTRQHTEDADPQITDAGHWEIGFGDLLVEGEQAVRAATTSLRTWVEPDASYPGTRPRTLRVRLGDGRNPLLSRDVFLTRVAITYTRFTRAGAPSRAKVTLAFRGAARTPWQPAAPAADGERRAPAAGAHRSPGWRPAARANGVDDPLREGGTARIGGHR